MARHRRSRRPLAGAAKRSHDQKRRHEMEPSGIRTSPNNKHRYEVNQPASTATAQSQVQPATPRPPASPTATLEKSNLQRQKGQRQQAMQRAQERAVGPFTPGPLEIHLLLAFMHHMQTQKHPHERRYPLGSDHLPLNNPASRTRRFSKLLDALANICVSRARGNAVATAIRYHYTDKRAVLFIATNGDIPQTTIDHVKNVWNIPKKITAHVHSLRFRLVTEVIRFTFLKLEKRVLSKINKLRSIPLGNLREDHPWHLRAHIESLAVNISRIREGRGNNDLPLTEDDCTELLKDLANVHNAVDRLLENRGDEEPPLPISHQELFPDYRNYLRKLICPTNSCQILAAAAMSPDCRIVFTADLKVEALQTEQTQMGWFPESIDEWIDQLRLPMKYYNYIHHTSPSLILNFWKGSEDCEKVHQRRLIPPKSSQVHCEVKLLLRLYNDHHTDPQLPPAFAYIGNSKPSCVPCSFFMASFNKAMGTRFATKTTHSKVYWPWGFPDNCPKQEELCQQLYTRLCDYWIPTYRGYAVQMDPLQPDSYTGEMDEDRSAFWEEIAQWKE